MGEGENSYTWVSKASVKNQREYGGIRSEVNSVGASFEKGWFEDFLKDWIERWVRKWWIYAFDLRYDFGVRSREQHWLKEERWRRWGWRWW